LAMPMAGAEATGPRNPAASHLLFRSAPWILKAAPSAWSPALPAGERAPSITARQLLPIAGQRSGEPDRRRTSLVSLRVPSGKPDRRVDGARGLRESVIAPGNGRSTALFVKAGLTLGSVLDDLLALEIVTGAIGGAVCRQP
jgi:hypothetical protein